MRKNMFYKVISLILVAALPLSFAGCGDKVENDNEILADARGEEEYVQQEYTVDALEAKKAETVYSNAKPDGAIYQVKVTDWLHTSTPQVYIEDKSNLKDIVNINTLTSPRYDGDKMIWDMDTTDLYYSGMSEAQPPVSFNIKYFLNGTEMTYEEIAGQEGDVKIEITPECNLKKDIEINKQMYKITCPMLVAGGTILPEEHFENIAIDYGTAISDGSKQVVFFAGVPGLDESLGISNLDIPLLDASLLTDTYTITAHTDCFETGNMMFAAIPSSAIGTIGNSELVNSIDSLKDVLTDIETVQAAMKGLNMEQIIALLYGDANKVEDILKTVKDAAVIYSRNEKLLKTIGKYMTDENIKNLDKLVTDLNNADIDAISETLSDPKLKALLGLMPKLSASISDITVLASDMNAVMPLFDSIAQEMDDPEIQKSIEMLPDTLKTINSLVNTLSENKELLNQLAVLAGKDSSGQIESIIGIAEEYADIGLLSKDDTVLLAGKMKEWLLFGNEYDIYTDKTENMSSSILFTYKTDPITRPVETDAEAGGDETAEDGNAVVRWFKNLFS